MVTSVMPKKILGFDAPIIINLYVEPTDSKSASSFFLELLPLSPSRPTLPPES